MPELGDFFPELSSLIFGLLLAVLGVPSPIEIFLMIAVKIQEVFPSTIGIISVFAIRLLVWWGTFEVILRSVFLILGSNSSR